MTEWGVHNYGANLLINKLYDLDVTKPVVIDVETDEKDNFVGLGYTQDGNTVYFSSNLSTLGILFSTKLNLIGHNLKFDAKLLVKWGMDIKPEQLQDDTILMSYTINATKESHSLKDLGKELGYEWPTYSEMVGKGKKKVTLDQQDVLTVANYCAMDVLVTYKLYEKFIKQMDLNQRRVYQQIEMPLMRILFEMELQGVLIDVTKLQQLDNEFSKRVDHLTQSLRTMARRSELNPNSNRQIAEVLEGRGIALETTQKGNKKVDKFSLEKNQQDDFVKTLIEYNKLEKLVSTYTGGLLKRETLPKVYTTYNQVVSRQASDTGISTGRLSSSNPNLQQIPTRTEEGKLLRELFIPNSGYTLIDADYSQIEYRLLAHFTKEPVLLEAFHNEQDIHEATGNVLGCSRDVGKTLNFACLAFNHRVLLADMTWMPVQHLRVGDKILTCEENNRLENVGRGRARRWTVGEVTYAKHDFEECVRVSLSNGQAFLCTKEHPFLVNNNGKAKGRWVRADQLQPGWKIPKYLDVCDRQESFEAGWLSGMMDGEGFVSPTNLSVAQKPGETFDKVLEMCRKVTSDLRSDLSFTKYNGGNSPCNHAVFTGGFSGVAKVLGMFRPQRLIKNFLAKIVDKVTISAIEMPEVVKVEEYGRTLIVRLSTSTHTYCSDGYFSHNSIYGASAPKIARTAKVSEEEAEKFLKKYWSKLPSVTAWITRVKHEATKKGGVFTLMKRWIPIEGFDSRNKYDRWGAERKAVNYLIQGSAAEIIKMAMIQLKSMSGFLPLLTVHDELLFESEGANTEEVESHAAVIKSIMEDVVKLAVPLVADVGIGVNWRKAKGD